MVVIREPPRFVPLKNIPREEPPPKETVVRRRRPIMRNIRALPEPISDLPSIVPLNERRRGRSVGSAFWRSAYTQHLGERPRRRSVPYRPNFRFCKRKPFLNPLAAATSEGYTAGTSSSAANSSAEARPLLVPKMSSRNACSLPVQVAASSPQRTSHRFRRRRPADVQPRLWGRNEVADAHRPRWSNGKHGPRLCGLACPY